MRWREALQRRSEPLPFILYLEGSSDVHHDLLELGVAWEDLGCVRGWCRLRSQAVQLAELEGAPSRAAQAQCIFCGACVSGAEYHHVLAECPIWEAPRAEVAEHSSVAGGPRQVLELVLAVLRPRGRGAEVARGFAAAIDDAATEHWAARGYWA